MDSTTSAAAAVEKAFVRSYKALYLLAIAANAAALLVEVGFSLGILQIYLIDVALFGINSAAWLAYKQRKTWGLELEIILSVGRMLMILLASTIFLAGIVALFSPIGWLLWYKVMFKLIDRRHRAWYWSVCGTLLLLEALYLYCLEHVSRGDSVLVMSA